MSLREDITSYLFSYRYEGYRTEILADTIIKMFDKRIDLLKKKRNDLDYRDALNNIKEILM